MVDVTDVAIVTMQNCIFGEPASCLEIIWLLSVGAVLAGPRYGLMFLPASHLGPDDVDTQAYPPAQVISWKGPEI